MHGEQGFDAEAATGESAMQIHPTVRCGQYSIVGAPDDDAEAGVIAEGVVIGSHCLISASATIGPNCEIDSYVRIGAKTRIGANSKILYNARVFRGVAIGTNCVISGDIPNFVTIEDDVTFMGDVAHSHRNAHIPWDEYDEPSPIIRTRSVVGVRALLIGPVEIGPRSYVAAGEVVRHDVPPDSVYFKGKLTPLAQWKGMITVREPGSLR